MVCGSLTTMQVKLRSYSWWLLLPIAVGLAIWFWPKSVMRERYNRIQIGMTQAEVAEIMGAEQTEPESFTRSGFAMTWQFVSEPPPEAMKGMKIDHQGFWYDPSVDCDIYEIGVQYCGGKTVFKHMKVHTTPWLHEWFWWLVGPARTSIRG
jgi:hypothetical protein